MFAPILARLMARHHARNSLRFLLSRTDDHLLEDIGISRAEAEAGMADVLPHDTDAIAPLVAVRALPC